MSTPVHALLGKKTSIEKLLKYRVAAHGCDLGRFLRILEEIKPLFARLQSTNLVHESPLQIIHKLAIGFHCGTNVPRGRIGQGIELNEAVGSRDDLISDSYDVSSNLRDPRMNLVVV
jgi:hypothetical protein